MPTAAIDYAAEYNNRARVPEHPVIMAGWARDAAAYRDERPDASLGIAYGPSPRMRYDWFPAAGDAPVVLFIHGGYWQALDGGSFSHMARGANAHGVAMAVATYDLCPQVTIAAITEAMRQLVEHLARQRGGPVTVFGHSAGGHLAAELLATDWRGRSAAAPPVTAAMPVSGLFELEPLVATPINAALGLDPAEARACSPLGRPVPAGTRLIAMVGGDESGEYLRQSRELVETWGAGGARARLIVAPGANHFTVLAPFASPDSSATRDLVSLAQGGF